MKASTLTCNQIQAKLSRFLFGWSQWSGIDDVFEEREREREREREKIKLRDNDHREPKNNQERENKDTL